MMRKIFHNDKGELNIPIIVALIGATATLLTAFIAGIFGLIQARAAADPPASTLPPRPTLTAALDFYVDINGPKEAPAGEATWFTLVSPDAERLEWTIPGFNSGAIDNFNQADQIFAEPKPESAGRTFTLVVTAYDANGNEATASHDFTVVAARAPTVPPATPLPTGLRALPLQTVPQKERFYMEALTGGELMLVDGCLRIGEEYAGQQGHLIVWPPGFWADEADSVIVVRDAAGQEVARVGQFKELGGGAVPTVYAGSDSSSGVQVLPPPECPGPYWVVGEYRSGE